MPIRIQTTVFAAIWEVSVSEAEQRRRDLLALGEAIGQIRTEHGLSQGQLAGASGASPQSIVRLEAGRLDPRFEMLLALADAMGVRPSAFFQRAEALQGEEPETSEGAGASGEPVTSEEPGTPLSRRRGR